MSLHRYRNVVPALLLAIAVIIAGFPFKVHGDVQPIQELEDKLENISEEEKAVLQDLFSVSQEIDNLELETQEINKEITSLEVRIDDLEKEIVQKQEDYNLQLELLKQVLVNNQRGGPASYLEILLRADNLSTFLKSLNIIKDISHNVNDLLANLKESKAVLEEESIKLSSDKDALVQKEAELAVKLQEKQELVRKQEDYLAALQTDREHYQEQLNNLNELWLECKILFPSISAEISEIIEAGYITMEDMNLNINFFNISGYVEEDTFNRILSSHSILTQSIFHFDDEKVMIEFPEKRLVLSGYFNITGSKVIQYEITEGTFYDMPLEAASIEELLQNGPPMIDFGVIAEDMITIDFQLTDVWSSEGALYFEIRALFW